MSRIYIDIETTGVDPVYHSIIEVGAFETDPAGHELSKFHAMSNPGEWAMRNSDPRAFEVNGLDPDEVRAAPPIGEVAERFRAWLTSRSDSVLHAFPNAFERGFLVRPPWLIHAVWGPCIMELVQTEMARAGALRYVYGKPKWPKLTEAAAFCKVPVEKSHRALPDAITTAKVHLALIKRRELEQNESEEEGMLEDTA